MARVLHRHLRDRAPHPCTTQSPMSNRTESGLPEPDWNEVQRAVEQELLDRVKDVARRITERVKKVTEDTGAGPALGDGPAAETPPVG